MSPDRHPLTLGESTRLCERTVFRKPDHRDRVGAWRDVKALEVHQALIQTRAACHLIDVCLGALLRLMVAGSGYRRWGHVRFADYVTQELRQRSSRRFHYLVAIDRAIAAGPLPRLGRAWRSGDVSVSQARELIRVMTPGNEESWLAVAASCSVDALRRRVQETVEARDVHDDAAESAPRAAIENPADGLGPLPEDPDNDGQSWVMRSFSATRPVDVAWQICLETSRRMAGFELPVHECVEDLLAEYASGGPITPPDTPAAMSIMPATAPAGSQEQVDDDPRADAVTERRRAWARAARVGDDAWASLRKLSMVARQVRFAADPLAGLATASPSAGGTARAAQPDPEDLHRRIVWLLRVEGNIAWHQCQLLRAMAELKLPRRLGFRSLRQYAVEALGSGDRSPWSLVRLARNLERLPMVAAAFRRGLVTSLQAEEICRVAAGGTQSAWIDRARSSTLRALQEDVEFILSACDEAPSPLPPARPLGAGRRPCAPPAARRGWDQAGARPISAAGRVRICAPSPSAAVARSFASRVEGWYSAFGEDRDTVVQAMLSAIGRRRPVAFLAPCETACQWDLTLAHCRLSSSAPAPPDDSQCVALLLLDFLDQWASPEALKSSAAWPVMLRDGWRCQVPRCRSRARLHAHHIIFRSHNGPDAAWNLITVCLEHHRMLHAGVIRARGRAPDGAEWSMGVNATGEVRERFVNETRVALDLGWAADGPAPVTRGAADWRPAG